MTDERRAGDRREEDVRLAEAVEHLKSTLDERFAAEWEKAHTLHDGLADADHGHAQLDEIVMLLEGTEGNVLRGERPKKGLVPMVNEMWEHQQGGWTVQLPVWAKVAALALAVTQTILTVLLIVAQAGG